MLLSHQKIIETNHPRNNRIKSFATIKSNHFDKTSNQHNVLVVILEPLYHNMLQNHLMQLFGLNHFIKSCARIKKLANHSSKVSYSNHPIKAACQIIQSKHKSETCDLFLKSDHPLKASDRFIHSIETINSATHLIKSCHDIPTATYTSLSNRLPEPVRRTI